MNGGCGKMPQNLEENVSFELERDLLLRAGAGDAAAFCDLLKRHEKLVLSQAFRMMGNVHDARDAAQEALIKIFKNIHKCRDAGAFKSWIIKITNNTCIDMLRKRKTKREESLNRLYETGDGEVEMQFESADPGPDELYLNRERHERIQQAINKLPAKYREIIVLRDIMGLSYEELASSLAISDGTVKSRLSRAREKLKKLLVDEI
jgi:RNA polymerase sigma-70 factor (ECF subfamily)